MRGNAAARPERRRNVILVVARTTRAKRAARSRVCVMRSSRGAERRRVSLRSFSPLDGLLRWLAMTVSKHSANLEAAKPSLCLCGANDGRATSGSHLAAPILQEAFTSEESWLGADLRRCHRRRLKRGRYDRYSTEHPARIVSRWRFALGQLHVAMRRAHPRVPLVPYR